MEEQIDLNGQTYDIIDGTIKMDREQLLAIRVEDIPIGVMIRTNDDEAGIRVEPVGVRNCGEGKAEVLVRYELADTNNPPLSASEYFVFTQLLILKCEEQDGKVKIVKISRDLKYAWIGVTLPVISVGALFSKSRKIVGKIVSPLLKIESKVHDMLDSLWYS